jgi:hypothetical protein
MVKRKGRFFKRSKNSCKLPDNLAVNIFNARKLELEEKKKKETPPSLPKNVKYL